MANDLQKTKDNPYKNSLKLLLSADTYKMRIQEVLGERAPQFMSTLISTVNSNAALADCDPGTVIASALKAAILDLPIDPNFGFAHLVPYNNTSKGIKECQFQIGYKGYVQLALRTGQYRNINVMDIRKGELKKWNPLTEELIIEFVEDEKKRNRLDVVGYAAFFSLKNGYEKTVYWSVEKITDHAKRYSQQFKKYGTGNWKDNFDEMAKKTLVKHVLNKWGILSIEVRDKMNPIITALESEDEIAEDEIIDEVVDPETGEVMNESGQAELPWNDKE